MGVVDDGCVGACLVLYVVVEQHACAWISLLSYQGASLVAHAQAELRSARGLATRAPVGVN